MTQPANFVLNEKELYLLIECGLSHKYPYLVRIPNPVTIRIVATPVPVSVWERIRLKWYGEKAMATMELRVTVGPETEGEHGNSNTKSEEI